MQIILTAILSIAILAGSIFGIANYATLGQLNALNFNRPLGVSLTTISSATKISDLATILPNNFNSLNAGKIENSSSSIAAITTLLNLTSVGTIGTGIWRGTIVQGAYGGTGLSSPTQYLVMLGNGTVGLTVASSTGTSGQFLTSNGAGAYPSWTSASVDTNIDYTWAGSHYFNASTTFNATTTIAASSVLSNALILNSLAYKFPTSYNASTTALLSDGAGNLIWNPVLTRFNYAAGLFPLIYSAPDKQNNSASYNKYKEIMVGGTGTTTVYFELRCNTGTAYGRIYKNGSAVGTERTTTSTTLVPFSEDISVVAGDLIQIYAKEPGANYAGVANFQIRTNRAYDGSTVTLD